MKLTGNVAEPRSLSRIVAHKLCGRLLHRGRGPRPAGPPSRTHRGIELALCLR